MTVTHFKELVAKRLSLNVGNFGLVLAGKPLEGQTYMKFFIENCALRNGSTFMMFMRLLGGWVD